MRPRWHDWIITLAIVALAVTGVWTLWGKDLRGLWKGDDARAETPAQPTTPTTPSGNAQGPF